MEKEFIAGKQIKNMKDNGRMELNMVQANNILQMVIFIKDNINFLFKMVKEFFNIKMEKFIADNFLMVVNTAMVFG